MFIIQGPYPSNTTQIVLPSPRETNTEGLKATVQTIRMDDGTLKTYVKRRGGRKKFRWEFLVGNAKAKELEDYFIDNSGDKAIVYWRDNAYIGNVTLNPFEMSGEVQEYYRAIIEFEETA